MTSRQLFLVARQTYLTRIKSFGYWALVLAPVLIVGVIAGITFIITATQSHKTPVVGVVNQPALTTYLKKTDGFDAKVKSVATEKQAKADLRKGKLDAYLKETGETKFQLVASADGESVSETKLKANLTSFSMLNTAAEINLSVDDATGFEDDNAKRQRTISRWSGGQFSQYGFGIGHWYLDFRVLDVIHQYDCARDCQ